MANTTDLLVTEHYVKGGGLNVTFEWNGKPRRLIFDNYKIVRPDSTKDRKFPCGHDIDWFKQLGVDTESIYDRITLQDEEYLDATGRTVYKAVIDNIPRIHLHKPETKSSLPLPNSVGFICASCHSQVFGVLLGNLQTALEIPGKRIKDVWKMFALKKKKCLFPQVITDAVNNRQATCIPIDLIPLVVGYFSKMTPSKKRDVIQQVISTSYTNINANSKHIGVHHINVARVASLTQQIEWRRRQQNLAFNTIMDDMQADKIKVVQLEYESRVAKQETAVLKEKFRRLDAEKRTVVKALSTVVKWVEQLHSSVSIIGGLTEVVPLPGVDLLSSTRLNKRSPSSGNKISKEDFLETLDMMADLSGVEAPSSDMIEDIFIDISRDIRTRDKPNPKWWTAYQKVKGLCDSENPTFQEIRQAFTRWTKKRGQDDDQHLSHKRHKNLDARSQEVERTEGGSE